MSARLQAGSRHAIRVFARLVPPRVGILSMVTLLYLVTITSGVLVARMPSALSLQLQTTTAGTTRIAWLLPGGNLWDRGLRAGNSVLLLDGRVWRRHTVGSWIGREAVVRLTNGRLVTATPQDMGKAAEAWPLLVLSPWFFIFGCLLFHRAEPVAVGRAAFALFALAAEAFALGPIADSNRSVLGQMAERVVIPCFAASFACFFLVYPAMRIVRKRLWAAILLPAALAAVLDVWGTAVPSLYPFSNTAWLALLVLYLALGVSLAVYAFIFPPDASAHLGLRVIAAVTALAVLPFVGLSLAPLVLGLPPLLRAEHAVLATAWLPAGFTYATVRHAALKAPLKQRWLAHGVLWVGISGLYGLISFVIFLNTGLLPHSSLDITVFAMLLSLAVGGTFSRLYLPLQRAVDQWLFNDEYDYQVSLPELSRHLSAGAVHEDFMGSLPAVLKDMMNLQFVSLFVCMQDRLQTLGSAGTVPDHILRTADCALRRIQGSHQLLSVRAGSDSVLLAPLVAQDRAMGCLCLGSKRCGEPFQPKDISLLLSLASHLATSLRNVQLNNELREQLALLDELNACIDGAQEQERARLAAEIHDEVLQTALHLQRQISESGDSRILERQLDLIRMLVDQLRALVMGVRPAGLDEFGLAAALETLAHDLGRHAHRGILVDADPAVAELSLSPEVELMLYRAAQEALNNAIKHAQAATLLVTLRCEAGGVELCVTDDGVGFSVPSSLAYLPAAGHLGLAGIQRRVQRSGGSLEVISQPGRGTTVRIRLLMDGGQR